MASNPVAIPKSGQAHEHQQQQQQQPPLRLSTRRGSMAAPDPWSLNAAQQHGQQQQQQQTIENSPNPGNAISVPSSGASRITIVRLAEGATAPAPEENQSFPISGPTTGTRPGRSNSWGSNYSASSNTSSTGAHPRNASPGGSRRGGGLSSLKIVLIMY